MTEFRLGPFNKETGVHDTVINYNDKDYTVEEYLKDVLKQAKVAELGRRA